MTKEYVCKMLASQKLISIGTTGKDYPDNSVVCFSFDEVKTNSPVSLL